MKIAIVGARSPMTSYQRTRVLDLMAAVAPSSSIILGEMHISDRDVIADRAAKTALMIVHWPHAPRNSLYDLADQCNHAIAVPKRARGNLRKEHVWTFVRARQRNNQQCEIVYPEPRDG